MNKKILLTLLIILVSLMVFNDASAQNINSNKKPGIFQGFFAKIKPVFERFTLNRPNTSTQAFPSALMKRLRIKTT